MELLNSFGNSVFVIHNGPLGTTPEFVLRTWFWMEVGPSRETHFVITELGFEWSDVGLDLLQRREGFRFSHMATNAINHAHIMKTSIKTLSTKAQWNLPAGEHTDVPGEPPILIPGKEGMRFLHLGPQTLTVSLFIWLALICIFYHKHIESIEHSRFCGLLCLVTKSCPTLLLPHGL